MLLRRALCLGLFIWAGGTLAVRLAGERLLQPGQASRTLVLYLVSFCLMALLVPGICRWLGVDRDSWAKATTLLILPTLVLDPFSCLFFTMVFPNLDPASGAAFGGWMLMCCGGGVVGLWITR